MHRRLGSADLSQLAFPGESNPNFSCKKSQWDNTVVLTLKKKEQKADRSSKLTPPPTHPPSEKKEENQELQSIAKTEETVEN